MKDTVRTTMAPGYNWPTLRDTQPPPKPPKPKAEKQPPKYKPRAKKQVRRPPILHSQIVKVPTKTVEQIDYESLVEMLEAGPVYLDYAGDKNRAAKALRERGYPVSRRTHRMRVEGLIMTVTTLRKI